MEKIIPEEKKFLKTLNLKNPIRNLKKMERKKDKEGDLANLVQKFD